MKHIKSFTIGLLIIFSAIAFVPVIAYPWEEKIDWSSFASAYEDEPVHYYVNTFQDEEDINIGDGYCWSTNNKCSLRAAISEANLLENLRADVIIHLPAGEYPLILSGTDFHLLINRFSSWPVVIQGEGAETTIIKGNQTVGLFDLQYSATFRDVTLRDGYGGLNYPGAIFVRANSELILVSTVIQENYGNGGALKLVGAHSYATLDKSALLNNESVIDGGAINNLGGNLLIKHSVISGNSAPRFGGGIYDRSEFRSFDIFTSTISGNSAWKGSAIASEWIVNGGRAGINISSSTISGNSSLNDEGVAIYADYMYVAIRSSIVFGNPVANSPNCSSKSYVTTNGNNISTSDCLKNPSIGDQVDVDPLLGPLQNNGGNTLTHALLSGSPAINGGVESFLCTYWWGITYNTDQRGFPRPGAPFDTRCDIGAYEWNDWQTVYLPLITR